MYKKVCCTCKVAFFLLIRPIAVFHRSPALPSLRFVAFAFQLYHNKYRILAELPGLLKNNFKKASLVTPVPCSTNY